MAHAKDFIGRRHGNLMISEFAGWKEGKQLWKCKCDCGNNLICNIENLERGKIKSCGCMKDSQSMVFVANAEKRILGLIDKQEDCWLWKGLKRCGKRFYPYCNFHGEQFHPVRFFKKMMGQECPPKRELIKKCYTPNCVNPDHYELKSISKRRQNKKGEKNDRVND